MNFFYLLSPILGYVMRWLYMLVNNYGWAIVLFTILVRILMFPLSLKQQKSQARMTAYQPMIKEVQDKWAKDKNRQAQEVQKFYEENNIKMSAGCLPMIANFLVLFGVIGVIQAPLSYIVQTPAEELTKGYQIVDAYKPEANVMTDLYTQETVLTGEIKNNPTMFVEGIEVEFSEEELKAASSSSVASGSSASDASAPQASTDGTTGTQKKKVQMGEEYVNQILDFNFDINLFGTRLNLATTPDFGSFGTLVMPILSLLTMFGSQIIIMKTSGQAQGKGTMIIMTVVMGVMFGFFAFRVPVGFSLYYTISNVVMTVQQFILKKIYDPAKIREEVEKEIEERRKAKKAKKKVVVQQVNGESVTTEVNESELVKMRLAKARELDAKRYGDAPDDEEEQADDADTPDDGATPAREIPGITEGAVKPEEKPDYKPGRRKRARKDPAEEGQKPADQPKDEGAADAGSEDAKADGQEGE